MMEFCLYLLTVKSALVTIIYCHLTKFLINSDHSFSSFIVLFLLFPEPSYSGPDEVHFFRGPALDVRIYFKSIPILGM